MESIISIYERGILARNKLEDMLLGEKQNEHLRKLIDTIDKFEETMDTSRNWWIAYNTKKEKVIGMITVRNETRESFLEDAWMSTTSSDELQYTIAALIGEWEKSLRVSNSMIIILGAKSQMADDFYEMGFSIEKPLLITYKAPTKIYISDDDNSFFLRKPELSDLEGIYDELIQPDLDRDSLIYISRDNFLNFKRNFNVLKENGLVVTSENGVFLGFGASFLDPSGSHPILYGPHGLTEEISDRIISEFLTYWSLNGKEDLILLRNNYLPVSIEEKYLFKLIREETVIRYCKDL